MKNKLWIYWLRHREAIIILFCLLTVLILSLLSLSFLAENYPLETLILGGAFMVSWAKRKTIQKLLKL